MTTSYPGAVDNLTNPTPSDTLNSATVPHAAQHANANDAIEAIQTTLGTNPQGSSSTVKDRIAQVEAVVDDRLPGEAGSNQPTGTPPNGYVWVNTTDNSIKVWNGTQYVDPSNAGSGSGPSWAVASGGTETTPGGGWKVHRFDGNGTLTVSQAGQAEVLIVGGGSGRNTSTSTGGGGGDVVRGIFPIPAGPLAVVVGAGGPSSNGYGTAYGKPSSLGTLTTGYGGFVTGPGPGFDDAAAITSDITGTSDSYGRSEQASPRTNRGDGGGSAAGSSGVVIIRYQQ